MRSDREILDTAKAYKALGMLPPPLSAEEKARAYGDPRTMNTPENLAYWAEKSRKITERTVRDLLQRGVKLPKSLRKEARELGISLKG